MANLSGTYVPPSSPHNISNAPANNQVLMEYPLYVGLHSIAYLCCSTYEGTTPNLIVYDGEWLKEAFIKQFPKLTDRRVFSLGTSLDSSLTNLHGDHWKHVRTLLSPSFTTGKLKKVRGSFNVSEKLLIPLTGGGLANTSVGREGAVPYLRREGGSLIPPTGGGILIPLTGGGNSLYVFSFSSLFPAKVQYEHVRTKQLQQMLLVYVVLEYLMIAM